MKHHVNERLLDVIVVGGGYAGLSAALLLGRSRRRVVVFDEGGPRNAAAKALRAFLSRDGIAPSDFRSIAREQVLHYPSVRIHDEKVTDAVRGEDGFTITTASGERHRSRMLLLATGVIDEIPEIENIQRFYGRSVVHCPYCDGWEHRDEPIAAYGRERAGYGLALELTQWSQDVVLCTDGPGDLSDRERSRLRDCDVDIYEQPIVRLDGEGEQLSEIVFQDGQRLERSALFFKTAQHQRSTLPGRLGCTFNENNAVATGEYEVTSVPGLYVAGDASRHVQLAVVAAAEGAKAAFAINTALLASDVQKRRSAASA